MSELTRCAVCSETADLRGVVVAGEERFLCAAHHRALGQDVFQDLETLLASPALRRRGPDRRRGERRAFPRPEGRRLNDGRRVDDGF